MRVERSEIERGVLLRVVEEPRVRYPARPVRRTRSPAGSPDPDALLTRLGPEGAAMATRVLREGARGWRRWSTLRRRAGDAFSPFAAEGLLDDLCREAGLVVEDAWRHGGWAPQRFAVDPSVRPWLGVLDPQALRDELAAELTAEPMRRALERGPPGVDWRSFAFVLRAGERLLDLAEHGIRPGARELAGLIDHTKAWTPRRRALLEEIVGRPFDELVAKQDRQIGIRGPLRHREAALWASSIASVDLAVDERARGLLLVENAETFRHLLPLADEGWIVLHVPGGPPPAETELVSRILALAPGLEVQAVFDLDPAGIGIALLVAERAGTALHADAMTPELLGSAPRRVPLTPWDIERLEHLRGRSGPFEPLVIALSALGAKAEQETLQRHLLAIFRGHT